MEILLIDIGALALFLGCMAIVYWHGVSDADDQTSLVRAKKPEAARNRRP
jgi:hypothetical protein